MLKKKNNKMLTKLEKTENFESFKKQFHHIFLFMRPPQKYVNVVNLFQLLLTKIN